MQPPELFPPSQLDRVGAVRTDAAELRELWLRSDAQRVGVRGGEVAVQQSVGRANIALSATFADARMEDRVLLGMDPEGRPWWLVLADNAGLDADVRWTGLRELGPQLSALEIDVLMTAVALESWHARHGYCPACGQPTTVVSAGWVRRCSADGIEHYPRTDPAIIVLVIDEDDRALLGRQTRWPKPWRSTLAGFVEPGERAESAVRREVFEEVGVPLDRVRYVASQPWPFPGSLMLGFHAWTSSPAIEVDGVEIAEAAFYTREQIRQAATSGTLQLPPSISIARTLIERWFGSPIPGNWSRG